MSKKTKSTKTDMPSQGRIRLASIDMMIGLAMTFVVLGHMSVGSVPYWYSHGLHNWIYSFHMPLFMMVSGYFGYKASVVFLKDLIVLLKRIR